MHVNDIRRWVQAMHNPNRLYFDDVFARESVFGRIVAPQSFTVCCDVSQGLLPATVGSIPGSETLFGGDEWWFFGPRIEPGDTVRSERFALDYKLAATRFAGPTIFQRGVTTYVNQRNETVARQRSTAVRYLLTNARLLERAGDDRAGPQEDGPHWSDAEIEQIQTEKIEYYRSFQDHVLRTFEDVTTGEDLPKGVIGPHSVVTFTTEWRAYPMNIWGAQRSEDETLADAPMADKNARIDPALADGAYRGDARGHLDPKYARLIGMPRPYGYGASMGAWVIDYVANWAGENALVVHSVVEHRSPALVGDVTYIGGRVMACRREADASRGGLVAVAVEMKTQTGQLMADGVVEVSFRAQLPA